MPMVNSDLKGLIAKHVYGRSEAELATSRSRRLPAILNLYGRAGKKHFYFSETRMPERGANPRSPTSQAGSFNHSTRATPHDCGEITHLTLNTTILPYTMACN